MLPQPRLLPCQGKTCLPGESFSCFMLYTKGLMEDRKRKWIWQIFVGPNYIQLSHSSLISGIFVLEICCRLWHWSQCPLEIIAQQRIDVKSLQMKEVVQDFFSLTLLICFHLISWPETWHQRLILYVLRRSEAHLLPITIPPSVANQTSGISPRTQIYNDFFLLRLFVASLHFSSFLRET